MAWKAKDIVLIVVAVEYIRGVAGDY